MNETGSARRLQSERLVLVPLRIADADEMVDVLADPRLYTHTGGCPPDLATLRDRYARQVRGRSADGSALWFNWIVRTRGSLAAVGYVQVTLGRESGVADMAWVIGSEHQGHGYASEAAGAVLDWLAARLDVRRITAHIAASNLASQKVARRLGFAVSREVEEGETVWEHVRQSSSG
jgi:RimJ/RimL family protein N-acetyltransferase